MLNFEVPQIRSKTQILKIYASKNEIRINFKSRNSPKWAFTTKLIHIRGRLPVSSAGNVFVLGETVHAKYWIYIFHYYVQLFYSERASNLCAKFKMNYNFPEGLIAK